MRWAVALIGIALAPRAFGDEVLVFAASSTTDALTEIARDFKGATRHEVKLSFASSSLLARQIVAGAPADVFLSADLVRMDELEKAGLVRRADRRELLGNQLVIIEPAKGPRAIEKPDDLAKVARIAVADPEAVPLGVYARKWLESIGIWESVRPKIVPTLDARAALAAVETEQARAGIVYRTDAASSQRVRVAYVVPAGAGPPIVYPVAVLAGSKRPKAARELVEFLGGSKAHVVFLRYGFTVR